MDGTRLREKDYMKMCVLEQAAWLIENVRRSRECPAFQEGGAVLGGHA